MGLSLFRFIAALGRTQVVANTLGTFTLLVVLLLGGFVVAKDDIAPWMIWGYYASPMMYGQNAIVMNEFLDERWNVNNTDPRFDAPTIGRVLLNARGFFTQDYWFWICIGALFGFSILFNILFIGALTFLNPFSDSKTVVFADDDQENKKKSSSKQYGEEGIDLPVRSSTGIEGTESRAQRKGMVLPFQPLSLVFSHINYYVNMPALLLMKRGGQVIYAGPLGHHSQKLIEYFEWIETKRNGRVGDNNRPRAERDGKSSSSQIGADRTLPEKMMNNEGDSGSS
ncbi:hypothetical protein ACFE04_020302 [Oxalis oulophora]